MNSSQRPTRRATPACISLVACLALAATAACAELDAGALVLVNSTAPDYQDFPRLIEPYLSQFGVSYKVRNISRERLGPDAGRYALVVIGHRGLDAARRFLRPEDEKTLLAAVRAGTGLVSFDGLLAVWSRGRPEALYGYADEIFGFKFGAPEQATAISVRSSTGEQSSRSQHYITRLDPVPRAVKLTRPMAVPGTTPSSSSTVLAYGGGQPLLVVTGYGRGRAAIWTSTEWMKPEIKGKLYGLDDLVWRSLVWAARRPFVLRSTPHYLALRIDDVSGFGLGSNRQLGYVSAANRNGLKPWLGIFLDDLRENPAAVQTLARLTQQGLATASVHARRWRSFFYLDEPLLNDELGVNVAARDLPDEQIARNFAEAEEFFAQHGILKSKFVIPHFYEFGNNVFEGLRRWGAEYVATVLEPGRGYGTPLLQAGPYLTNGCAQASNGQDPIYIADWLEVPGHPEFHRRFFNFVEEVRDVAGYEWAPSGVPVEEAIRRGVEESRREFDSLLPAVLFTHESDHIQHIAPEDWERILRGVMDGLKAYEPIPVTLDFLAHYLRALRTSRLVRTTYDTERQVGTAEFDGRADVPTKFCVFDSAGDDISCREFEAASFEGRAIVHWHPSDH